MHSGISNEIDKISLRSFPVGSTALGHRKLELYVEGARQSAGLAPARCDGYGRNRRGGGRKTC